MSRSLQAIAPRSTRSIARRWPRAAGILARRDCGRITTPTITALSCSIPMATISRRCATRPREKLLERRQHEDRDVDDEADEEARRTQRSLIGDVEQCVQDQDYDVDHS